MITNVLSRYGAAFPDLLLTTRLARPTIAFLVLMGLLVGGVSPRLFAQACVAPPSGLVSWWPGDGDANDVWHENDGAAFGVTYGAGQVGQAILFDVGDYVRVDSLAGIPLCNSAYSYDFWVYVESYDQGPAIVARGQAIGPICGPEGAGT